MIYPPIDLLIIFLCRIFYSLSVDLFIALNLNLSFGRSIFRFIYFFGILRMSRIEYDNFLFALF